jgi:hypothetical protein
MLLQWYDAVHLRGLGSCRRLSAWLSTKIQSKRRPPCKETVSTDSSPTSIHHFSEAARIQSCGPDKTYANGQMERLEATHFMRQRTVENASVPFCLACGGTMTRCSSATVYACTACVFDSCLNDSQDVARSDDQFNTYSNSGHVSMCHSTPIKSYSEGPSGFESSTDVGPEATRVSRFKTPSKATDANGGPRTRFKSRDPDIPEVGNNYNLRKILKPPQLQDLLDEDRSLPHSPPIDNTADTFCSVPSTRSRYQI